MRNEDPNSDSWAVIEGEKQYSGNPYMRPYSKKEMEEVRNVLDKEIKERRKGVRK